MTILLKMQGITKRFQGVSANTKVHFSLAKQEIHALLGENGAGKSTLMNILYGLYRADEGEIFLNGKSAHISCPKDSISLGIGMVHQHFKLVPVMRVVDNIILGNEIVNRWGMIDIKAAVQKITELMETYDLYINPYAIINDLPVGLRQRVEILKALYRDANILILDEPTAILTPEESSGLYETLKRLSDKGKSIIFITHKLKEVMKAADRITIMREGRNILTTHPKKTSEKSLAQEMVGKDVSLSVNKGLANPKGPMLEVKELSVENQSGVTLIENLSFEVRSGEIFAICGVSGNGQHEMIQCITGLIKEHKGSILFNGQNIANFSPKEMIENGVSYIPEDRHTQAMVGNFSIADNLILNLFRKKPFSKWLTLNRSNVDENAYQKMEMFQIQAASIHSPSETLSGGNQQKMVIAREFSRPLQIIITEHPTRGLDIGSATFIHQKLLSLRDKGCAVLLVSGDLDEVFSIADRIAVMYKGRILNTIEAQKTDLNKVGLLMGGIAP